MHSDNTESILYMDMYTSNRNIISAIEYTVLGC